VGLLHPILNMSCNLYVGKHANNATNFFFVDFSINMKSCILSAPSCVFYLIWILDVSFVPLNVIKVVTFVFSCYSVAICVFGV